MKRVFVACLLALAACGNTGFFGGEIPEGLHCGANGACPPGQKCAAWENRCRIPCSLPPGPIPCTIGSSSSSSGCECAGLHNPAVCDTDGFCRLACGGVGGPTGACGDCGAPGFFCDAFGACRPPCTGDAGACGGQCKTFSGNPSSSCTLCLPP